MSRRQTSHPVLDAYGDETHPAFGTAVVLRASGTGRPLFQSDLMHRDTITLCIHRATRKRDLNRDWVHPAQELIEVEMSLAQWGSLVSSIGIGSGVPVTIRRTENEPFVDNIPHQPRIAANLAEVETKVSELIADVKVIADEIHAAVEAKSGIRILRDLVGRLRNTIGNAPKNAAFAVKSMDEAAEKITNQARADIEVQILTAVNLTGAPASIELPKDVAKGAIEAAPTPEEDQ